MLRLGIVGLPGSGKTSLFRALTGVVAEIGAAGRREIHVGQAKVPDARLDRLFALYQPRKETPAVVEYVDVAGIKAGETSRSGLEDQFLGDLRTCEALLAVLRHFEAPGLPLPDPARDFRTLEQEFILSDHIILEKRLHRVKKDIQKLPNRAEANREIELLERCLEAMEQEIPLRRLGLKPEEMVLLKSYQPLSLKPVLAVLNVGEEDIRREGEILDRYRPAIEGPGVELAAACASIEMEIAQLDPASAREFMDDLGIAESALDRLVRASYHLLGLISFFTIGHDEVRAWTIPRGERARQAAGEIHSDLERGFIRAEVVHFDDFMAQEGSMPACRAQGLLRQEGKDYIVQDGDIMEVRFAV
ncbi:MAG: redox-regulated ATPase YchF [Candidatus Zixiibacteriota bacterium]|nr:MAG: redox-regulated ATPase YchF [candidate division Zixibacteria bacterium]